MRSNLSTNRQQSVTKNLIAEWCWQQKRGDKYRQYVQTVHQSIWLFNNVMFFNLFYCDHTVHLRIAQIWPVWLACNVNNTQLILLTFNGTHKRQDNLIIVIVSNTIVYPNALSNNHQWWYSSIR